VCGRRVRDRPHGRPRSGGRAAREEVDLVGEDLGAVARDPVLVLPLGVVDAALDADQLALGAVLADGLGEAVEAGHPVELAFLGGVAVLVLVGLAVLVACGAIGDDGDPGNVGAALGLAGVGIAGDAAGEDCDIGHGVSPSVPQAGDHLRLANIQKKQGMGGLHRRSEAPRETCS